MTSPTGRHAAPPNNGRHRVTAAVAVGAVAAVSTVATVIGVASATAATTPTGPVIITIASNSVTSNKAPITVVGAINAKGVDIEGESADLVKFPKGTFTILHPNSNNGHDSLNPTTCVDLYTETGKFSVTAGTGAYKGVSGKGTYNLAATSLFKKVGGKCDENVEPITSHEAILGTAVVS